MLELEYLIVLSLCVSFNTAISSDSGSTFLISQDRSIGRGWGWHSDHGVTTFLDKIVSLLTFLSFGVFLLNLLLNALLFGSTLLGLLGGYVTGTATGTGTTGTTTTTTTTTVAPAPSPPAPASILTLTGSGSGNGGLGLTNVGLTLTGSGAGSGGLGIGRRRGKRSTFELQLHPSHVANIMARELMEMIQAVVSVDEECLPRMLCVTNRRASVAGNGFQYLMPLCSFGVSYFGEKLGLQRNLSTNINAIYNGIDEQNCSERHTDCNLS